MPEANRIAQQPIYQLKIFSNISRPQIKQGIKRDQARTGACFIHETSKNQVELLLKLQADDLSVEFREAIISEALVFC
ncbi:hypothetical protein N8592_02125 [Verrucomicrobia bacterium]|nr:hypothetical protein [Verrucomicrobiota bacterium]